MKSILAPLLVSLVAVGCGASTSESKPNTVDVPIAKSSLARNRTPAVDGATSATLRRDNLAFAASFYKQLGKTNAGKNMFFSPSSISTAFAMLYGGARTTSEKEISDALHFTLPQPQLHPAMNRLGLDLESRASEGTKGGTDGKGFRLNLENSFWGERTTKWESTYLDLLAVNYGAGVNQVDFIGGAESARKTINAWTEEKTEGKIKDLLKELRSDTRFVLVNTVYFNASWLEAFSPTTMSFQCAAGKHDVPAIQSTGTHLRYAKSGDTEIVGVPYDGNKIELVAIVPSDLAAFEATMDDASLESLFGGLKNTNLNLTMPTANIEGDAVSLKNELQALGLKTSFGGGDFSGMTPSNLTLDEVFHKAFVKWDEKGTEAAAATAIIGRETSAQLDPPKPVNIDRPFLFFVRDVPTGTVLFGGRVLDL